MHENIGSLPFFEHHIVRFLRVSERSFRTSALADLYPIVIEPLRSHSPSSLSDFLKFQSNKIKNLLYNHGAVLLRGWNLASERQFEDSVLSLDITPMDDYFRMQPGRGRIADCKYVYYTSTINKSGGSFQNPGLEFHVESAHQPEMPAFQFLWCKRPPLLGGETALIRMTDIYEKIPLDLRKMLEDETFFVRSWPVSQIARLYEMNEDLLLSVFKEFGLEVKTFGGQRYILLFKPAVFRHAVTGKYSLQISFKEIRSISHAIKKLLLPYYSGRWWWLHRKAWSDAKFQAFFMKLDRMVSKMPQSKKDITDPDYPNPPGLDSLTLASRILDEHAMKVAEEMVSHVSMFRWRRGDLLMLDNTQMVHCGMPGAGPRELRVMLANQIPFKFPAHSGVLDLSLDRQPVESLRSLILQAKMKVLQ